VDARAEDAIGFLQKTVDVNSGTMNHAGVRAVGAMYAARLDSIGFRSRWAGVPTRVRRAGHLFAERRGTRGKRLLLIGHLDTVYQEGDAPQLFVRSDSIAIGPGVLDAKGGNVALLFALIALQDAGVLDSTSITVALTGDEEVPGLPPEDSRGALLEAATHSDIALAFEAAVGDMEGASPVRLGFNGWTLRLHGGARSDVKTGPTTHPTFPDASRIVQALRMEFEFDEHVRVYPIQAIILPSANDRTDLVVRGGMRFASPEELVQAQARIRQVTKRAAQRAKWELSFETPYPGMPPRAENFALLATLDSISRALGGTGVIAGDPHKRGGGDISFVSHLLPGLDGLGPSGRAAHSPDETVNLNSLAIATKRAAVLIYRLTR
jgi:glutamate carboxypeptidase